MNKYPEERLCAWACTCIGRRLRNTQMPLGFRGSIQLALFCLDGGVALLWGLGNEANIKARIPAVATVGENQLTSSSVSLIHISLFPQLGSEFNVIKRRFKDKCKIHVNYFCMVILHRIDSASINQPVRLAHLNWRAEVAFAGKFGVTPISNSINSRTAVERSDPSVRGYVHIHHIHVKGITSMNTHDHAQSTHGHTGLHLCFFGKGVFFKCVFKFFSL